MVHSTHRNSTVAGKLFNSVRPEIQNSMYKIQRQWDKKILHWRFLILHVFELVNTLFFKKPSQVSPVHKITNCISYALYVPKILSFTQSE